MASFDDSDDIKINTTLDTDSAVKAAQDLKSSIEAAIKATATQFSQLEKASKQLGTVLQQQANKEVADTKQKLDQEIKATSSAAQQEVAIAQQVANEKVAVVEKAIKRTISAEQRRIQELKVAAKQEMELEKTKRTQMLKDIAELNLKRAVVRKTPRSELPAELGGIASARKDLQALGNLAVTVGTRFGLLTGNVRTFGTALSALGPGVTLISALPVTFAALSIAVNKLNEPIDRLAKQAGNLEGLKTGFETLQRSVGQDPAASINKLREATQGLISDTELYQRANQAVLLGVPTKTFNEAAAAAVKLGRAMGIDAAFGLESLSLGLGRQSRLYLDNLGIIVSAEEAYLRFAQANDIVGRTLSDSEKKAAFFEEALRKIKERADELPDILDSVGIALKKVEVAQANVSAKFLEGFNRSSDLAKAYGDQAKTYQGTAEIFERLGAITGAVGAKLKTLQNVLIQLGLVTLEDTVLGIDAAFGISAQQKYEDAALAVALIEQKIKETTEALNDPRTRNEFLPGLRRDLESSKIELDKANKALNDLGITLGIVQTQGANGIKIKVDLTDLNSAKLRLAGFIDELQADVLAAGGEFEIPGLSKDVLDTALKNYESLISLRQRGAIDAESAKQKLSEIVDPVSVALQTQKLKDLNSQIGFLTTQQLQASLATGRGSDEIANQIAVLEAQKNAVVKGAGASEEAVEALKKAFKNANKEGVKAAEELKRKFKDQSRDAVSAVKKQSEEWDKFLTSLNRQLGTAIDPDIQVRLADIFRTTTAGSTEMIARLEELGKEVQKRKGDLNALAKEAGDYLEVVQKGGPVLETADKSKAEADVLDKQKKDLQDIQDSMINIRKLFTSEPGGGGFFGFDIPELGAEQEGALAGSISDATQLGLNLAFQKFTRDDAPELGQQIGTAVGASVGAALGGPAGATIGAALGGPVGQLIGEAIVRNTQDLASTKQRKNIDKYFSDIFDGQRLGLVIQGQLTGAVDLATGELIRETKPRLQQISSLVFEGFTPFAGFVRFGGEGFRNYFDTLSSSVQASFNGIGLALSTLQGISVEQARLIGVALSNNIGGSLQNLQVLVQQTGESFDDLSAAIIEGFLQSQLTIDEAYNALLQLQNLYEVGIPGAIGAWEEANKNLSDSLEKDNPGQYAIDSLRDIGAEGLEARASFETVIAGLAKTFNFTGVAQTRLFEALKASGIASLADLQKASDAQLVTFLKNIKIIQENSNAPLVSTPQVQFESKPPPSSSGSRGRSPEDERKEALKKLLEETQKLLRESKDYEKTLERLKNGELSNVQAGAQIIQIRRQIEKLLKDRNNLEKEYDDLLAKGAKANKKRLGEVAAALDANKKAIDKLTEGTKEGERVFKKLNISAVIPLIKSANTLGVVSKLIGVDLETTTNILVQGFLRGKLTLQQFNQQLKATQDNLGKGIPNEVGAVTKAFQNLVDAGVQGGAFSVDAFTDIFAEFREKFQQQSSIVREGQRKDLLAALENAKAAQKAAIGPEAALAAQKTVDAAEKALNDFYSNVPTPNLADLRSELEAAFGSDEVSKFFRAIDEGGLKSFQDLENAGSDAIIKILAKLTDLGFKFGETSQEVRGIQDGLNNASNAANANTDPIQAALDLIKQFNEGANGLPVAFDKTTEAVDGLNGTLGRLKDGFDDIIFKLAQLQGNEFKNDVVFNVRTEGDTGAKALVEILFGSGDGSAAGVGNGGTTTPAITTSTTAASIARKRSRVRFLEKNGRGNSDEAKRLRREIRELGG